ncbi:MAG: hypothetical protein JXB06_11645 [Spirochaetales bacterium]|nr:hypothetical protein [Spirochaetales bacterium]
MKPVPVDLKLNLNAGSELSLRSGDSVVVRVIKQLSANKWAVGIRGRVLPAVSRVELAPGQRLRALVEISRGRITLKISGQPADPIRELIARQGFTPNQTLEAVVSALLRSAVAATPERVQQVRLLLERMKLDPKKFARLLAIMLEKGIDLKSRGLEQLVSLLGYGEREPEGGEEKKRRMPRDSEKMTAQLRKDIGETAGAKGSSLQVFNHLRCAEHTWIVIPFRYGYEPAGLLCGAIRLRYDVRKRRTDRMILAVRNASGDKWSFVLENRREPRLHLFGDPSRKGREIRAELDVLRLKLQNLGVKIDDTIREDQIFDGFDLPWEELSYRNIDTVH